MLSVKFAGGVIKTDPDWMRLLDMSAPLLEMNYVWENLNINFSGFERYLRLKENVEGLNAPIKGVSKIILLGQMGEVCTKVTIDLINGAYKKEENVPFENIYEQPINGRRYLAIGHGKVQAIFMLIV